jgi:hypothetical protein
MTMMMISTAALELLFKVLTPRLSVLYSCYLPHIGQLWTVKDGTSVSVHCHGQSFDIDELPGPPTKSDQPQEYAISKPQEKVAAWAAAG